MAPILTWVLMYHRWLIFIQITTSFYFSSEIPQPRIWSARSNEGRRKNNECNGCVRSCAAYLTRVPRHPNKTENFTGPSFISTFPGRGAYDRQWVWVAARWLSTRIQAQGNFHFSYSQKNRSKLPVFFIFGENWTRAHLLVKQSLLLMIRHIWWEEHLGELYMAQIIYKWLLKVIFIFHFKPVFQPAFRPTFMYSNFRPFCTN